MLYNAIDVSITLGLQLVNQRITAATYINKLKTMIRDKLLFVIFSGIVIEEMSKGALNPLDTGRKLNTHKTLRRRPRTSSKRPLCV